MPQVHQELRALFSPGSPLDSTAVARATRKVSAADMLGWARTLPAGHQTQAFDAIPFAERRVTISYLKELTSAKAAPAERAALMRPMLRQGQHLKIITFIGLQKKADAIESFRAYQAAGGDAAQLGHWIAGAGALLKAAGAKPGTDGLFSSLVSAVGSGLQAAANAVAEAAEDVVDTVVDTAASAIAILTEAVNAIVDLIAQGGAALAAHLNDALSKGAEWVESVATALLQALKNVGSVLDKCLGCDDGPLQRLVEHLVRNVANGLRDALNWVLGKTESVALRVVRMIKAAGGAVRKLFLALCGAVGKVVAAVQQALRKLLDLLVKIGETIAALVKEAAEAAIGIFLAVEKWLSEKGQQIAQVIEDLYKLGEIGVILALAGIRYGTYVPALNAIAKRIPLRSKTWTGQTNVTQIPGLRVFTAKAGGKYAIFSDLHRGSELDKTLNLERAHRNQALYVGALEEFFANGYTLIENGDCEDFWNNASTLLKWSGAPENPLTPVMDATRGDIKGILALHAATYAVLRKFHQAGRYVKVRGNHDNIVDQTPIRAELEQVLGAPLTVYDAVLIPANAQLARRIPLPGRVTRLPHGRIIVRSEEPLDPRNDILVLHGHQFDHYNADEHYFLGQCITTCSLIAQAGGLQNLLDDPNGAGMLSAEDRRKLLKLLPAFTNAQWKDHLRSEIKPLIANKTYDTYALGEAAPLLTEKALCEDPVKSFGETYKVSVIMGHTHETKLFSDSKNGDKRLFGNSGTGGMWEGALSYAIVADGHMRVEFRLGAGDADGETLLSELELKTQDEPVV